MSDLRTTPVPIIADLTDVRTGAIVHPNDRAAHAELASGVDARVSRVEVALNDCLHLINGHLNECCLRLGVDRNQAKPNARRRPSDDDVEKVIATCVRCCRDAARVALTQADKVRREPDPVLRDARTMLRQFCQSLAASVGHKDVEPWLFLCNEFSLCAYLLVTDRAKDVHRVTALFRWKAALTKATTMAVSKPMQFRTS